VLFCALKKQRLIKPVFRKPYFNTFAGGKDITKGVFLLIVLNQIKTLNVRVRCYVPGESAAGMGAAARRRRW
jgi:hypothetical protein